jgi:hypothetical protein
MIVWRIAQHCVLLSATMSYGGISWEIRFRLMHFQAMLLAVVVCCLFVSVHVMLSALSTLCGSWCDIVCCCLLWWHVAQFHAIFVSIICASKVAGPLGSRIACHCVLLSIYVHWRAMFDAFGMQCERIHWYLCCNMLCCHMAWFCEVFSMSSSSLCHILRCNWISIVIIWYLMLQCHLACYLVAWMWSSALCVELWVPLRSQRWMKCGRPACENIRCYCLRSEAPLCAEVR